MNRGKKNRSLVDVFRKKKNALKKSTECQIPGGNGGYGNQVDL